MPPSLVKPPRWAWNPALLEPAGKGLARGLDLLVPLWDDGKPAELVSGNLANYDTTTAAIGPYGMVKNVPSVRTDVVASWSNPYLGEWDVSGGITVALFVDITANSTGSSDWTTMLAYRKAANWGTSDGYGIWLFNVSPGVATQELQFQYHSGGVNTTEKAGVGTADEADVSAIYGAYNLYAYSSESSAAGQLYRNGEKLAMAATSTGAPDVSVGQRLVLGNAGEEGLLTESHAGNYLFVAKWNRTLSDDEHALLAADPFVLLRRNWAIPTVLTTSGTIALTAVGSAASAGDAVLSSVQSLTGSGGAASAGDSVLTAKQTLVGAGSAASAGVAVLTSTQALQGVGEAASAGDGTISSTQALQGSGAAASDGVGIIAIGGLVALTGTGAAASDGTGTISSAQALQGVGSNASAGVAVLTVFDRMVGAGGAASAGDAVLTSTQAMLGVGQAASAGVGTITSTQAMLGVGSNTSAGVAIVTIAGTTFWTDDPVAFTTAPVGHDPVKKGDPTPW